MTIRFETELCTGLNFEAGLPRSPPKVYFDGFEGATTTIMYISVWTVCQMTVGTVGFYCIKIQPLPSLTDNICSEGAL